MPLSANRELTFFASPQLVDLPVDADVTIYKGAFVGLNPATGYARPLTAGDAFVGIAYQSADNSFTGNAAGGITVRLHQNLDIIHPITGVAIADLGASAYASADDSLTLTPTGNSPVGRVVAIESSGVARVRCTPAFGSAAPDGAPVTALADANVTLTRNGLNRVLTIANTTTRTITLPAIANLRIGDWIQVIKTSAAAAIVVLLPTGATINGNSSYTAIDAQYDTARIVYTSSGWLIASKQIA